MPITARYRPRATQRLRPDPWTGNDLDAEYTLPLKLDLHVAGGGVHFVPDGHGLDYPQALIDARRALREFRAETFQPSEMLAALAREAPSLLTEAENEWRNRRTGQEQALQRAADAAENDAMPGFFAQAVQGVRNAVQARDETELQRWVPVAMGTRGGTVRGTHPDVPNRRALGAGNWLWWIARPDLWHQAGKPPLTAATLADHPELGIGPYAPSEVIDNMVALGARRRAD